MIQIFLIDDHPIVREGMGRLIEKEPDMTLCGESDGSDIFGALDACSPDIIVLDLSLPQSNGLDIIHSLKLRFPKARVLVLSMHDENLYAARALRAGAMGYIMKQEAPTKVINAIRKINQGLIFVSEEISRKVLQGMISLTHESPIASLSDRELQVFQMIGEGRTHNEIAQQLTLSVKTIESHVERIKNKLEIRTGRELIHRAIEWVLQNQGPVQ